MKVYLPKNTVSLIPYPEHEQKVQEVNKRDDIIFPKLDNEDLPIVPFKRPIRRRLKQNHFKILPTKHIPSFKQTKWYELEKKIQKISKYLKALTNTSYTNETDFVSHVNQIEDLNKQLTELKKQQTSSTSIGGILDEDFDSSKLLNSTNEFKKEMDELFLHSSSSSLRLIQLEIAKAWLIYWVQSFTVVSQLYPTKEMLIQTLKPYRPTTPLATLYRGLSFTLSELAQTSTFWDQSTQEFGRLLTIDKYSSWTYSHDAAEEFADTASLQRDDAIAFIIFSGSFESEKEIFVDIAKALQNEYPMRHEQEVIVLPIKNKPVEIYKTNIPPIPLQAKQEWLNFLQFLMNHSTTYRIKFEQDEDNEDKYKIYITNRKQIPFINMRKWRVNSKYPNRIRLDIKSQKWLGKDYIAAFNEFLNLVKDKTSLGGKGEEEEKQLTISKHDIANKWISPFNQVSIKIEEEIVL